MRSFISRSALAQLGAARLEVGAALLDLGDDALGLAAGVEQHLAGRLAVGVGVGSEEAASRSASARMAAVSLSAAARTAAASRSADAADLGGVALGQRSAPR